MATVGAIDVGTTKTSVLIGEMNDRGSLQILGVGIAPSAGMRKGVVVDVRLASQSIQNAVLQAERSAGMSLQGAYVGIAGAHVNSVNSHGVAAIGHRARGVCQEDVDRAMDAARAIAVPQNREIIHAIPRSYALDGVDGVRDPIGMMGFRLEVETHIVTGASASIQNLAKAVAEAQVQTLSIVLEPIAAGEAVLMPAEREMGVALVDIGGGTTDLAIFMEGSVLHTAVLPTGGLHVTNDLAVGLEAPFDAAEDIKLKYGHVDPTQMRAEEYIDITAFGEEGHRTVARREVAEIIRARAEETVSLVGAEIQRAGYKGLLPAGIVLTGGSAQLVGLRPLAREILGAPVRLGTPRGMEGFTDRISSPAFSASVGLVMWGLARESENAMPVPRARVARRNTGPADPSRAMSVLRSIIQVFTPG